MHELPVCAFYLFAAIYFSLRGFVCSEHPNALEGVDDSDLPLITIAVFITVPTPFVEQFFNNIKNLDYPSKRIMLYVHNAVEEHDKVSMTYPRMNYYFTKIVYE